MSARYFVTGAQGFVGRFTIAHILAEDRDAEIVGIGRSLANDSHFTHPVHWGERAVPAALPSYLEILRDGRYRYERTDLADRPALETSLRSFRPDFIVHLASGLRDDPFEHLFRTNVEGTAHLVEALAASGIAVRCIVFGSSGAVYGRTALRGLPLDEEAPCLPADLYSVSKLASEHVSRIMSGQLGLPAVWARIFNIVGPGQDERHICGKLAAQAAAIRCGVVPARFEAGDLTSSRDFIDVRDVAAGLSLLARRGEPGTVYNVASGRETSMQSILESAMEISGLSSTTAVDITYHRAADIPRVVADVGRMHALGFGLKFDMRQSMSDLIDYYGTTIRAAAERT